MHCSTQHPKGLRNGHGEDAMLGDYRGGRIHHPNQKLAIILVHGTSSRLFMMIFSA